MFAPLAVGRVVGMKIASGVYQDAASAAPLVSSDCSYVARSARI
jgi:hypothetical protein